MGGGFARAGVGEGDEGEIGDEGCQGEFCGSFGVYDAWEECDFEGEGGGVIDGKEGVRGVETP